MDKFGQTVAISGDGTHVAISSPESDENGNNASIVEVFKFQKKIKSGYVPADLIFSEGADNKFGEGGDSIALDQTGSSLSVGAIRRHYFMAVAREGVINRASKYIFLDSESVM